MSVFISLGLTCCRHAAGPLNYTLVSQNLSFLKVPLLGVLSQDGGGGSVLTIRAISSSQEWRDGNELCPWPRVPLSMALTPTSQPSPPLCLAVSLREASAQGNPSICSAELSQAFGLTGAH